MAGPTLFYRTPHPGAGPFWSNAYTPREPGEPIRAYGHPCDTRELSIDFGATPDKALAPVYRIKTTMKAAPQ